MQTVFFFFQKMGLNISFISSEMSTLFSETKYGSSLKFHMLLYKNLFIIGLNFIMAWFWDITHF